MNIERQNQTVWLSATTHNKLLVEEQPGHFYIPLASVQLPVLVELGLAISDALARHTANPAAAPAAPSPAPSPEAHPNNPNN